MNKNRRSDYFCRKCKSEIKNLETVILKKEVIVYGDCLKCNEKKFFVFPKKGDKGQD